MKARDKAVKNHYDQSTDYQLPPGELWWLCTFNETIPAHTRYRYFGGRIETKIQILFCMPKEAQTWFQANAQAMLLMRDELKLDMNLPQYEVKLWEP